MRSRGVSVVEVLASVAVFGIIAAGLAVNSVSVIRSNRISRDLSGGAALAQGKVEQLRALDPAANPADLSAGTHFDAANPLNGYGQAGGIYTRQWTVTRDTPAPGLATVVVTVSFHEEVARSMRVVAFVCQSSTCT
jgi:Tfp pilus assembly protein PilV